MDKYNNSNMLLEEDKKCEFEKCIFCNKITHIPKGLHINFRNFYKEGIGQLCFGCYTKNLKYTTQ